jgi:hypothetical protein
MAMDLTNHSYDFPTPIPDDKGLENQVGENNCFLNCVIQALWHLRSFRDKFSDPIRKKEHLHTQHCVFCALEVSTSQNWNIYNLQFYLNLIKN